MRPWMVFCGVCASFLFLVPRPVQSEPPRSSPASTAGSLSLLNEREFIPFRVKGRGVISGQAFLVNSHNKVMYQPGGLVVLLPQTRQSRDWFDRHIRRADCPGESTTAMPESREAREPRPDCRRDAMQALLAESRIMTLLRTTRTNPNGHFWFTKLPAGRYYVISPIAAGSDHGREPKAEGVAWTLVDLDQDEKATNIVVAEQTGE